MDYPQTADPDPAARSMPAAPAPLPAGALVMGALGALFLVLQLDVTAGGFHLSTATQILGFLLTGGAIAWVLRSRGASHRLAFGVTGVLLAAGAMLKFGPAWGLIPHHWGEASPVAVTAAFLAACWTMRRYSRQSGWDAARRSWTGALAAGAICYALPQAVLWAATAVAAIAGEDYTFQTHNVFALVAAYVALALPMLWAVRALGLTALAAADARGARRPRLGRWFANRGALVACALVAGLPLLLLVPACWHYSHTPRFDEYVTANGGSFEPAPAATDADYAVELLPGRTLTHGTVRPLDPEAPAGDYGARQEAGHHLTLRLTHGETVLCELEHEITAQFDGLGAEYAGAAIRVVRVDHDPRFHLVVRAVLDRSRPATPLRSAEPPARKQWVFPFVLDVALVSGRAPDTFEAGWATGLPEQYGDHSSAVLAAALQKRFGIAPARPSASLPVSRWQFPLLGAWNHPPPDGEGLRFHWRAAGNLRAEAWRVRVDANGRRSTMHGMPMDNPVLTFTCNYPEYSYAMEAEQKSAATTEGSGGGSSVQTQKQHVTKQWNGEIW